MAGSRQVVDGRTKRGVQRLSLQFRVLSTHAEIYSAPDAPVVKAGTAHWRTGLRPRKLGPGDSASRTCWARRTAPLTVIAGFGGRWGSLICLGAGLGVGKDDDRTVACG